VEGKKDTEQAADQREGQVLSMVERIYCRIRHLGRKKNLGNMKEAVEEFEREYQRDMEEVRRQEKIENKGIFARDKLSGRFTARKLFG